MKNIPIKLFVCFLLLAFSSAHAQDYIRTKKDTIQAKVVEIGLEEIKYRAYNNLDGPVIVIAKTDVIEITYQNGTKTLFAPDNYDVTETATAMRKKTRSVKYEFLSPLGGDLAFGYETMLKVGTNLEFKIGIIGVGFGNSAKEASGAFFKAGVKFLTRPSYVQRGVKYSHGLAGFYIKPEFIFNSYKKTIFTGSNTYPYNPQEIKANITNYALNIIFGKQYILGSSVTLDYYGGIGYGIRSDNIDYSNQYFYYYDYNDGYEYSHTYGGEDSPFVLSGGITIGVLF